MIQLTQDQSVWSGLRDLRCKYVGRPLDAESFQGQLVEDFRIAFAVFWQLR